MPALLNSKGFLIPFSGGKRIPWSFLLTAFAFTTSEATRRESRCNEITGTFRDSCTNITLSLSQSSDSNIPPHCLLIADCSTMYSGLPPVHNKHRLPPNKLLSAENRNGTIIFEAAQGAIESNPSERCKKLGGSHVKTCTVVESVPYNSTDEQFREEELCRVEINCTTLGKEQKNTLVHFSSTASLWKYENCNGTLIEGESDRCAGKSAADIEFIANNLGGANTRVW